MQFVQSIIIQSRVTKSCCKRNSSSLQRKRVKKFHFIQENTPHRTRKVLEAIYEVYGDRVIGLGCPKYARRGLEWPPYSSNYKPCDFYLWEYITDNCYSENPKTKGELTGVIKQMIAGTTNECSHKILYSFLKELIFVQTITTHTSEIYIIRMSDFLLFL